LWKKILLNIINDIYKLNVIVFIETDDDSFFVELNGTFLHDKDFILLLQNKNGIFPIIMTNIKTYLKNVVNLEPTEDVCVRVFTKTNHKKIYDILEDIIISYGDINVNKKTYFSEIEKEAESIFIKNLIEKNKVVSIYDLEDKEKPKIISQSVQIQSDYYTTIKGNIPVQINSYKSLFADITFIIEKDGTISNLRVSNWVNDAVDEKFKKELITTAIKTLKENYNHWKPGKYKNNIVRTENTLRVSFE
jgi:hypothetical protein